MRRPTAMAAASPGRLRRSQVRPQEWEALPVIQSVPRVRRTARLPTTAWLALVHMHMLDPHKLRAAVPQAAQGLYLDVIDTQKSARHRRHRGSTSSVSCAGTLLEARAVVVSAFVSKARKPRGRQKRDKSRTPPLT